MKKPIILAFFVVLCTLLSSPIRSQSDSILYTTAFYFEDAIGNKDTVYVSGSPYVDWLNILPQMGSVATLAPFDSVFEVRVVRDRDVNGIPPYQFPDYTYKHLVHPFDYLEEEIFCGFDLSVFELYEFAIQAKHLPVRMTWDHSLFDYGAPFGCFWGTVLVQTRYFPMFAPPEDRMVCMYVADEFMIHYEPTPNIWQDHIFFNVEGSIYDYDTLIAISLIPETFSHPACADAIRAVSTTSLDENLLSNWSVSPNPATSRLDIQLAGMESGISRVDVIDQSGRILQLPMISASSLDISGLAPGFYFLRLFTGEGKWGVRKFIKN